ncbi:hypothetical protein MRX96_050032 [Rhipicephalus microplus]
MSLAEARFNSDSWILRLSGCLPPSQREDRLPERQSRWGYTVLTATLVTAASLIELTSLLGRSLFETRQLSIFNGGLFFTLRLLFLAKVSSQLAAFLAMSREVRTLVARAAEYEMFEEKCSPSRALHLLVVTAFFTTRWYVFLTWVHKSIPAFLSASLSMVTAIAAAAVTAWDSAPGILSKCFAEVFVQYLRAENTALAAAARGQVVVVGPEQRRDDLRAVLSDCRANVEAILHLVRDAQRLLGTPLLLCFGANMGVVCAVLYSPDRLLDAHWPNHVRHPVLQPQLRRRLRRRLCLGVTRQSGDVPAGLV